MMLDNLLRQNVSGRSMRNRQGKMQGPAVASSLRVFRSRWPLALRIASLCVLLAGVCIRSHAGQVDLGLIGVYAGLGSDANDQQVLAFNYTNQDCTGNSGIFAVPCGGVYIGDWAVTVDYIVNDGVTAPGPVFNSAATCTGTNAGIPCSMIGPGNDPTALPLYSLPY